MYMANGQGQKGERRCRMMNGIRGNRMFSLSLISWGSRTGVCLACALSMSTMMEMDTEMEIAVGGRRLFEDGSGPCRLLQRSTLHVGRWTMGSRLIMG